MIGLERQHANVVPISEARDTKHRDTIFSAAMTAVAGDSRDPRPATALVAVSLYPGGDIRHTISMVEAQQVRELIGALLDVIEKLETFETAH